MADYLIKQDAGGGFSAEAVSERAQKRGGTSTKGLSLVFRTLQDAVQFVSAGKAQGFTFEETGLRLLKAQQLLPYFQNQKTDYEVTKRYAFDHRATRFDFVKGAVHFMFDLSDDLVADYDVHEIVIKLEQANWWNVLQSYPAPGVVTFSSQGFSFSKPT